MPGGGEANKPCDGALCMRCPVEGVVVADWTFHPVLLDSVSLLVEV